MRKLMFGDTADLQKDKGRDIVLQNGEWRMNGRPYTIANGCGDLCPTVTPSLLYSCI